MAKKKKRRVKKGSTKPVREKVSNWFRLNWKDKNPIVKFILAFTICLVLFYTFYTSDFYERIFSTPILSIQANVSSFFLNVFGYGTTVQDEIISGSGQVLSIKKGCDGMEPIVLFIIGVMLVPFSLKSKGYGILYGIAVLFVLNLVRIIGLFLVKVYAPSLFDPVHMHGGYAIFMVVTILVWISWAQWAIQFQNKQAHV